MRLILNHDIPEFLQNECFLLLGQGPTYECPDYRRLGLGPTIKTNILKDHGYRCESEVGLSIISHEHSSTVALMQRKRNQGIAARNELFCSVARSLITLKLHQGYGTEE